MESHHALGRRRLEEIRQKKAAQGKQTESNYEQDLEALKLELLTVQSERSTLQKQMEENIQQIQTLKLELNGARSQASKESKLATDLKQTIKNVSVERDAAIMAKEDLLAQLRVARKRLQEAEEEQYKAEEDAAALRAELKHLQSEQSLSSQSLHSQYTEPYAVSAIADQEMKSIRAELEDAIYQLQQHQQILAKEQQKVTQLEQEKSEVELAFSSFRKETEAKQQIPTKEDVENKWRAKVDKGRYEQHVRELASMVERLESGRQKLLAEIDMQSLEIEKLFLENAGLVNGLNETAEIATRWERQLRETIKQNAELHQKIEELNVQLQQKLEESNMKQASNEDNPTIEPSEIAKLKVDLTKALKEKDKLSTEIAGLSLELESAKHKLNGFTRLYGPVLSSLQSRLLQIKNLPHQIELGF